MAGITFARAVEIVCELAADNMADRRDEEQAEAAAEQEAALYMIEQEAPAMVAALRAIRDQRDHFADNGEFAQGHLRPADDQEFDDWAADMACAILSRIDGATPTDEPAKPTPTGDERTISAAHFDALTVAASKYADDLETGLEDGTYDDRADLDAVRAALAAVEKLEAHLFRAPATFPY